MALVNPNIAMSFKPTTEYQPRNALADYAQMQQIQTGDMQMQEYRRKSEGLERIRTAISKAGGPDDLETAAQEMMKVPEYFDQGYEIYQTIRDKKAFEEYLKGKGQPVGASPVGAPTAARPTPALGALGSGTFDIMPAFSNARYLTSGDTTDRALDDKIVQMGQSAPRDLRPRGYATPTNALAPATATAPVAAPTNAMVNPVEAIENEITQLSRFKDPRAQARVKQLERQLIAMEPTADVKTMRALGIPLTPAGYEQYRQAQRQEQLSVADRIAIAQAGRAPGTIVNMQQEKAEKGERGKMLVNQYSAISDAAKIASRSIPALENNLAILDRGFKTGFGTETIAAGAKVLSALGVQGAEKLATNSETFLANANAAVLQRQLEQKGPQTESDAQRITATGAQLGNTQDANKFVITVAKEQLKRDIEQRNFYDKWWKQNNTYDGAEDAWYSGEGGKSLFDRPALRRYSIGENAATAQIPTTGGAPAAKAIPPAAVQMLLSGKGTDAQFDAMFGAGAAKRARGGK